MSSTSELVMLDVACIVRESRARQGLAAQVSDPSAIARVVALVTNTKAAGSLNPTAKENRNGSATRHRAA